MERNQVKARLVSMMVDNEKDVVEYLKGLSPSGVELEVLSLANFDLENPESTPAKKID